ncbi:MAG: NYN domain-containing protein [Candidatus Njordarchaeum guaymaensis]
MEEAKKRGKIIRSRIYITQEELNDSRQALPEFASLGLEPVITVLAKNVKFAIDLLDDAYSDNIDVIIISWKSEDLLPALIEAKTKKEIVIMFPGKAPKSFYTVADSIIELEL